MPVIAKQHFYWKIIYSNGEVFPQFNEDGSENLFYQSVLKDPKGFENSEDTHKPLFQYEFRDDIVSAGWFKVTPELAEKNEILVSPSYTRNDSLIVDYGPNEKPFLMRTVKWTWTQEPEPHVTMYRIGRDGKTEYYLNRYGMIKKWEASK